MSSSPFSRVIRRYGRHPTSDLLAVDFLYPVPPDTEFPREIRQLDLFARFLVANVGPTRIAVRVVRMDDDGTVSERANEYRFTVPFDPDDRVREQPFRLPAIRLSGEGLYAVQIGRRVRHRWKGPRWKILSTDYFRVVREV